MIGLALKVTGSGRQIDSTHLDECGIVRLRDRRLPQPIVMTKADPMPGLFISTFTARAHAETLIFRRDVVKD